MDALHPLRRAASRAHRRRNDPAGSRRGPAPGRGGAGRRGLDAVRADGLPRERLAALRGRGLDALGRPCRAPCRPSARAAVRPVPGELSRPAGPRGIGRHGAADRGSQRRVARRGGPGAFSHERGPRGRRPRPGGGPGGASLGRTVAAGGRSRLAGRATRAPARSPGSALGAAPGARADVRAARRERPAGLRTGGAESAVRLEQPALPRLALSRTRDPGPRDGRAISSRVDGGSPCRSPAWWSWGRSWPWDPTHPFTASSCGSCPERRTSGIPPR